MALLDRDAPGFDLQLTLDLAGFTRRVGGRISCVIRPAQPARWAPPAPTRRSRPAYPGMSAVADLDERLPTAKNARHWTPGEALSLPSS